MYIFGLLVSLGMLMAEWQVRTHGEFALGVILTPLLLQGWIPKLATFWNTPAWTMCTEAFFYLIFPLFGLLETSVAMARPDRPAGAALGRGHGAADALHGVAAGRPESRPLYRLLRMRAPKCLAASARAAALFGIVLADVDARISRGEKPLRLLLGILGVGAIYTVLYHTATTCRLP